MAGAPEDMSAMHENQDWIKLHRVSEAAVTKISNAETTHITRGAVRTSGSLLADTPSVVGGATINSSVWVLHHLVTERDASSTEVSRQGMTVLYYQLIVM